MKTPPMFIRICFYPFILLVTGLILILIQCGAITLEEVISEYRVKAK